MSEKLLYSILPNAFIEKLAEAAHHQTMTQVIVCDRSVLSELWHHRPAMIELDDGAIIIMIPIDLIAKAYAG